MLQINKSISSLRNMLIIIVINELIHLRMKYKHII